MLPARRVALRGGFTNLADYADLAETTTSFRGEEFVRREEKDREEHVDEDGVACYFLRIDVRESAREHCEGLDVSERRLIDDLGAFLPELLWEFDDPDTRREL